MFVPETYAFWATKDAINITEGIYSGSVAQGFLRHVNEEQTYENMVSLEIV